MPGAHETHASIEAAAAAVLSLGGAAILVRAWVDRLGGQLIVGPEASTGAGSRADPAAHGVGRLLVVVLSGSAAAIHLAAGPEHVEALGDLGLGFYWAALVQGGFAVAWLGDRPGGALTVIGIVANSLLIGVWAWTRAIGLPFGLGGPEPIGVADGIAVMLELGIVVLVVARARGLDTRMASLGRSDIVRTTATSGSVAIAGIVVLATAVAVAAAVGGHGGDGGQHANHGRHTASVEMR